MKLHGTFLSSRAGRRIFWTLLLAAAVPITVFGVTMHQLLSQQFESQATKQQVQLVKFAGMGLLDRLLVARTTLSIVARINRTDGDAAADSRNGRVLTEVAQLDADGQLISGSASLAQRWGTRVAHGLAQRDREIATLLVGADHDAPGLRTVLIVLPDEVRRGRVWIAEIEPTFLFAELAAESSGSRICVLDSARQPVYCPTSAANDEAERAASGRHIRWQLFLRSDFAINDWVLVSLDDGSPEGSGDAPLAKLSALGALLTLLLVSMLGLIQVRRTMVPLELLIGGTRRLSEQDFSARVRLRQGDEFGELANSFNHMAERIDHQIHAMRVQSSIDHEILHNLDVERALRLVCQRLEHIVPGASAWVVEFDRSSLGLARVHSAHAPLAIVSQANTDLARADDEFVDLKRCDAPAWLATLLPGSAQQVWVRVAMAAGERFGLLMISTASGADIAAEARREIAELCNRVSIALSSADRERRLTERATTDSLTGLANRGHLYDAIDHLLAGNAGAAFSVLFLDLDRFKEVNDSLGHQIGDELLRAVARRLRQHAPPGALVARPGGDEFVLVVRGERRQAQSLGNLLCQELARPLELDGRSVVVGGSIGLSHHPEHGASALELMRRADLAMAGVKARGGGAAAWFDPSMDTHMAQRAEMLADLRIALARNEFEVHYQPRVQVSDRTVKCAEALLRWRSPKRGFVLPGAFIPLLEESGLIDGVGLWVIERTAKQLAQWRAQGVGLEAVAVNLSTRQLEAEGFAARVIAILARHDLGPGDLELEITESIFMNEQSVAMRSLRQLHDSGVRIALDDFGTGYSSLSYLHKLPITVLKVDRSFVEDLGRRGSALALTRSIIALAQALGLDVVAEGVETEEQVEILTQLGCHELQGWLFARALEPAALVDFMGKSVRTASLST
ncbi:MAG: EAL domain-containing protein [Burkholderiaceae bacterium]|nr:EAL domain-containing protein [Burkholderiaceae bacterium]